jgi:hypothetical protein
MKNNRLSVVILGLAVVAVAPAARADFCIENESTTSQILVGKGFVVPAKGECKPFNGFTAYLGHNSPIVGTGCMSPDGSQLNFSLFTTYPENNGLVEIDSLPLSEPSGMGVDMPTFISGGVAGGGAAFEAIGFKCGKPPVPIPDAGPTANPTFTAP